MAISDLKKLNIDQIQTGFKTGNFSSEELTQAYLNNIKIDKHNAFISINEQALAEAKQADKQIKAGQGTPLTGIPLAVKDIIVVKDLKATAGSKILENYVATYDATVIRKLKQA